jgi:hypothetical protein
MLPGIESVPVVRLDGMVKMDRNAIFSPVIFYMLLKPSGHCLVDPGNLLSLDLDHFPVKGDKSVDLVFNIGKLRVDQDVQALVDCGDDLDLK